MADIQDNGATASKSGAKNAATAGKAKNVKPAADQSGAPGDNNSLAVAGQSDANDSAPSATSTPGLEVTSTQDGFWRGDLKWSNSTITVKLCDLTEHQIEQIRGEPTLTVVDVDVPLDQEGA